MKSPRAGMVTNHSAAGPVYGERGRWASSCKLTPGAPPPPPAREAASTIWLYAHRGRTNLCGNNDSDEDLKLFHCSELDVGNFSGNFPHLKNFLRKSRSSGVQPESLRGGAGGGASHRAEASGHTLLLGVLPHGPAGDWERAHAGFCPVGPGLAHQSIPQTVQC